jgi:mannose-6-phosphate isomerase-like protein (cupin superfamily)
MTFGTTASKPWVEALPTPHATFSGRTFSRFHIVESIGSVPTVGEIWATSDHTVEPHAHDTDELLYVLAGAILINERRVEANEVVFIPRGATYSARVLTAEGAHVLRIAMPGGRDGGEVGDYEPRVSRGPLTSEGVPQLKKARR